MPLLLAQQCCLCVKLRNCLEARQGRHEIAMPVGAWSGESPQHAFEGRRPGTSDSRVPIAKHYSNDTRRSKQFHNRSPLGEAFLPIECLVGDLVIIPHLSNLPARSDQFSGFGRRDISPRPDQAMKPPKPPLKSEPRTCKSPVTAVPTDPCFRLNELRQHVGHFLLVPVRSRIFSTLRTFGCTIGAMMIPTSGLRKNAIKKEADPGAALGTCDKSRDNAKNSHPTKISIGGI